jgi:hypothetical protein
MTAIQRATVADLIAARTSAIRWSSTAAVAALTAELNARLLSTYTAK